MQKKVDRRVRKTKSQLRKGLARLMQEKSIGEITVKELVEEVDINRSTFYLHYSDIPTLLREIEDDMMEKMERAVREHPIKENSTGGFIEDIFRVLDENREVVRALVGVHGRELLAQLFPERVEDMKYFYSFCLNGCLGFVKTWLEDGAAKTPECAADMTFRMVVSSMRAFYDTTGKVSAMGIQEGKEEERK